MVLMPDGAYDLKAFAIDDDRHSVVAYAVFSGTHTGEGGPVPPSGKSVSTDYVYVMKFEGDKIGQNDKDLELGHRHAATRLGLSDPATVNERSGFGLGLERQESYMPFGSEGLERDGVVRARRSARVSACPRRLRRALRMRRAFAGRSGLSGGRSRCHWAATATT